MDNQNLDSIRTAFILPGGGVKGAFQVGAWLELNKLGIYPDAVYGTSVGALNAAAYAFSGLEGMERFWLDIKGKGDILYPHGLHWIYNFWRFFWGSGLHSTKPLRALMDKNLDVTKKPRCKATVCKVSLETGKIEYSTSDDPDFLDSVQASAIIPGIMSPLGKYVDGGVREVLPLKKAIDDGYNNIYILMTNPMVPDPEGVWSLDNQLFGALKVAYRCIDGIMEHEVFINDLELYSLRNEIDRLKPINFTIYAPEKVLVNTLEFNPEKIRQVLEQGRQSVLKGPIWVK